jgi:cell division protein FtsQ
LVAVARGSLDKPRARPESAPRGAVRNRASTAGGTSRAQPVRPARGGFGPRVALSVAALVILGGAVAGLALGRHEAEPAIQTTAMGRLLASVGFRLDQVQVQGAPEMARADILREAGLTHGSPILDIRLDDLRKRIQAGGWVKDAKVVRLLPDTLIIAVTPRQPLAVWQHAGATRVVDTEGQVMGEADPARFADLPLLVGEGAPEAAHAILPLLRQRPALMSRVDALIRVDQRRWDLRLKDGAIVLLPALGEDTALINLDRLDAQQRVLSLGLERIDLRTADALVVRPRGDSAMPPGAATTTN